MNTAIVNAEGTAKKAAGTTQKAKAFDLARVRADFPILSEIVHGKPLVYLDSANTSQIPLKPTKYSSPSAAPVG